MNSRMYLVLSLICFLAGPISSTQVKAQEEINVDSILEGEEDTENLYEKEPPPVADSPDENIRELSDLGRLAEFSNIAILQRKFLPKTGRWEFYTAVGSALNDAFFINMAMNARLAYYFREAYGIELITMFMGSSERDVTRKLRQERNMRTKTLVAPESYYGLDFKWTPSYGKFAYRNMTIVPFDLYFSAGLGITNTSVGSSDMTFHVGTGQIFALNKFLAFRWDFSWNFFSAETTSSEGLATKSSFDNLFLNLGLSLLFPEASYR